MKKQIALCLLIFISQSAFAAQWGQTSSPVIHTSFVDTANRTITLVAKLFFGQGDKSHCEIIEQMGTMTIEGFPHGGKIELGEWPVRTDPAYSCVIETFQVKDQGKEQKITYTLFNDGKFYNKTDPNVQRVTLRP